MIRSVIFDMDGLMFDTERVARDGWIAVGKEDGYNVTVDFLDRVTGVNAVRVGEICREEFGADFQYETFHLRVYDYMFRIFDRDGMPCKPGLRELLDYLAGHGIRAAVASSSSRSVVVDYLKRADIERYFDAVICGDMVQNSKPAPDIFLKAAELLETPPADCLVLEDSHNGVRAGYAAGMEVIMIPDLIPPTDELRRMADYILPTLSDVIPILDAPRSTSGKEPDPQ